MAPIFRTRLVFAALLLFAVALPQAQDDVSTTVDADELAAGFESATRYPASSGAGNVLEYSDPAIVSDACTNAVDPLECTAQEGSDLLELDAAMDAATADTGGDGLLVPLDTFTSSAPADAQSTADSGTTIDFMFDDGTASEFMVDDGMAMDVTLDGATTTDFTLDAATATTDVSVDGIAIAAVRSMERGFNTRQVVDYVGDGTARFERAMDEIDGTGVTVHRLTVYWWDVQCRGAGVWDWGRYDAVVDAAHARQIRVILNPVGSPNWARVQARRTPTEADNPCDPTIDLGIFAHPDNLNAWRAFIRQLALRYGSYDPIGYEIWNEQNSRNFWDPTATHRAPNAAGWARLYCYAVAEIDGVDPAPVGVGGLAVYRSDHWDRKLNRLKNKKTSAYLDLAYTRRASICSGKPFDFVGYHPYAYSSYFDGRDRLMKDTPAMKELADVRGVMRRRGQGSTKVWNTEWGFPSDFRGISEERQKNLIRREHEYLANVRDRYGYFMRFSILFNAIDAPSGDLWAHIGVVWINPSRPADTSLWRHKPSYAMWAALP